MRSRRSGGHLRTGDERSCYAELIARAKTLLGLGESVVIDASWTTAQSRGWRSNCIRSRARRADGAALPRSTRTSRPHASAERFAAGNDPSRRNTRHRCAVAGPLRPGPKRATSTRPHRPSDVVHLRPKPPRLLAISALRHGCLVDGGQVRGSPVRAGADRPGDLDLLPLTLNDSCVLLPFAGEWSVVHPTTKNWLRRVAQLQHSGRTSEKGRASADG